MLNFDAWMTDSESDGYTQRALDNARRIGDKAMQVTVRRPRTADFQETVRVELTLKGREMTGETGTVGMVDVILFGHLNHPTLPDTDLQIGDTVYIPYFQTTIEVTAVDPTQGYRLMAYGKAVQM
jgi:hypothetical protein